MNLKKKYNDYYLTNTHQKYGQSLFQFFENNIKEFVKSDFSNILDLGCGNYSMFEDIILNNSSVDALDFSDQAISQAPKSNIKYICAPIEDFRSEVKKYDLVFDSHCLHCIELSSRFTALENIYHCLKDGGIFCSETMVQPVNQFFKSDIKSIKSALEIENELLKIGFQIKFFYIMPNFEFYLEEYGNSFKCDLLRFIAYK